MTDGHLTDGPLTDGHLTDEQLSSQLDGESGFETHGLVEETGQAVAGHLAGCARCRARMAALEAARDLVRTPVPPVAPEARAESIATVLRRSEVLLFGDGVDDAGRAGGERHRSGGGRTGAGGRTSGESPAPTPLRTRMRPQVLVGSAAAVLILAAAVGVPLALSGRGSTGGSAESSAAPSSKRASAGGNQYRQSATATTGLSTHAAGSVVDLGPRNSVGALQAGAASLQPAASALAPNAAAATSTPGPIGAGVPTGAPGSASSNGGVFSPAMGQATLTAFERCLSSATHAAGAGRSVQTLAIADYKGTSALVYVFTPAASGSTTGDAAQSVVVATARTGCQVLVTAPV